MLIGPPDMSGTVERFSFPIVIRDYDGPGTVTGEGYIAAGSVTDTPTIGHMFPAKGDVVARLELQSPGAVQELHTPFQELRAAVKGSTLRGSVVVFRAREYEVRELGLWHSNSDGLAGYQQAWVQEVKR